MELRIFTEPQQGASYADQLAVAQATERLGFDAFFRSDHLLSMGGVDGRPGPTDSWVTLAGLARETSRIRLGTLVTAATFRAPGLLAVQVAQVDQMSGGRVELGIGTGWYEAEHAAHGLAFPPLGERFDRLEEQLEIVTGMWATPDGARYQHEGRHYRLVDCPGLPKPVQAPGPPVIVGGQGTRRTPALAARFAAEFNVMFEPLEAARVQRDRVRRACEEQGRDPASMVFSVPLVLCVGRDGRELGRRAAALGRQPDELRASGAAGLVEEVAATLRRWRDEGFHRVYLQFFDVHDLDHLELVAGEVVPLLD